MSTRHSPKCALLLAVCARVVSVLTLCCLGRLFTAAAYPDQHNTSERYEVIEPYLLIEGQQRPVSLIKSLGHPASLKVLIEVSGEQLLLALWKNEGLFASHYTETHYLEDGVAVTTLPNVTIHCYYHGEVVGHLGSEVTISTCTGLRGLISLEDEVYVLEPMHEGNTHRLYRGQHLKLTQGTCGHGHNISQPAEMFNTTVFSSHSARVSSD
ncbi:disintegrin and metalloproteinase domain-containing protein 12 [Danio aesculapii]|uniref:disintegrin and metalloproteinase domain-containing protein 12 n=1 Tax=Danio aesculapii TaxID=1142201 RepID=UPI0024BF36A0|nr:disintegrin and metalloproteinase domain-containing protein 12 [Danio aesculapii]